MTAIRSVIINGKQLTILGRDLNPEDEDCEVDTFFFDSSYSPAGFTGFTIWESSYVMVQNVLQDRLKNCISGKRIVELGGGTAFSSLAAAALGAHVLVTDLESVVLGAIEPNLKKNANVLEDNDVVNNVSSSIGWTGSVPVGDGYVAAMALDWAIDVASQVKDNDPRDADIILAADTVWLRELIHPFVATAVALMSGPRRANLYLAFRDRSSETSTVFAGSTELFDCFRENKCDVTILDRIDPSDERKGLPVTVCEISYNQHC
eukprot:CFRG4916T1